MANCEEIGCSNVQSAICLHCLRRLCAPHILNHGMVLLKEGDELCEQINELAEKLNISLQQIHIAREEAMHKLNLWRQDQIDKVEYKYAEKIQVIEFRNDHLTDLENELIQRLTIEAKQPLERMQAQQSASSQGLQTIRQAIANIRQDSAQLELYLKDSSSESSSSSVVNTTVTDKSHLLQSNPFQQQHASTATQYHINSSMNLLDLQSLMINQYPVNQTTSTVPFTITSNPSWNQTITMQTTVIPPSTSKSTTTTTAAAALPNVFWPQSAASASSWTPIERPPINPCRKLIKYFQNVSGSSDYDIELFIINNLNQVVHVNNMMVLLLSLLNAWHSQKSPNNILPYHINNIKEYIKDQEQKLTVIAAIQVFINSYKYDDKKSSEMMTVLLQNFFDQQCITKETVLDWYKNGASYSYEGFSKAKLWAKSFVDQLNTNIKSK